MRPDLLDDAKVRPYEQKDRERVIAIHKEAFENVAGGAYERVFQAYFENRLTAERTLVNEVNGRVLGFVSMARMDEVEYTIALNLLHALTCSEVQNPQPLRGEVLARSGQEIKDRVYVNFGKITPNVLLISPETLLGTDMAVDSRYQGKGLGTLLAEKALERAKEQEAPMILAQTIAKSPTVGICKKLGLETIVTYGPYYSNGDGTTILGMTLK